MASRKRKAKGGHDYTAKLRKYQDLQRAGESPGPMQKARKSKTVMTTHSAPRRVTNSTREAVFNTAELLEQIFLHLPAKTIYGSQRVCRQFRDIVQMSVELQQKLFLRICGVQLPT